MHNKKIQFRAANKYDMPRVIRLLNQAGLVTSDLQEANMANFILATLDDAVLGSVGLESYGTDGLLRSLCVRESNRGLGIGEQLLSHALERARLRTLTRVYLLTESAERFFSKHGFLPIEREALPKQLANHPQIASICSKTALSMSVNLQIDSGGSTVKQPQLLSADMRIDDESAG